MIIENAIVFNRGDYDYVIMNSDQSLLDIFNEAPVVMKIDNEDVCVGYVYNPRIANYTIIIGDIMINPMYSISQKYQVISQEVMVDRINKTPLDTKIYISEIITYIEEVE